MAPVLRRRKRGFGGEDCNVSQHADEEPSDEEFRSSQNSDGYWLRSTASYLNSLGDEELYDVIKKFTCNAVRQFISTDFSSWAGPDNVPPCPAPVPTDVSNGSPHPSSPVGQKTCSRLSVMYFQQVLDALHPEQRLVIIKYGFGCLLLFDRCVIPLGFARWLADHVNVETSEIVLKNMSIKISPQSVSDVLGLPIGGKEISRDPRAKHDFLSAIGANSLAAVKSFSDQLLNGNISDDEVVRNFLVVALVTFLCPHSGIIPSTEYFRPLVDIQSAKDWDWSKFIHYRLMKQIKKYQSLRSNTLRSSITLGGCLHVLCILYLDRLVPVHNQLPPTIPRISVWKKNMIKEHASLDRIQDNVYGKLPLLPLNSTNCLKSESINTVDVSNFKKIVLENVGSDMNPELLEGITSLYMKHTSHPPNPGPDHVQNVIVDVVSYFHQFADDQQKRKHTKTRRHGPPIHPGSNTPLSPRTDNAINELPVKSRTSISPGKPNQSVRVHLNDNFGSMGDNVGGGGTFVANASLKDRPTSLAEDDDDNIAMLSQTVLIGSFGNDNTSVPDSAGDTELVQPSPHYLSQEVSTECNSKGGPIHYVASRTRSRASPLACTASTHVDDLEAILRKKKKKKKMANSSLRVSGQAGPDSEVPLVITDDLVTANQMGPSTQSHLVEEDPQNTTVLGDCPVCSQDNNTNAADIGLQNPGSANPCDPAYPDAIIDKTSNRGVSSRDIPAPSFRLLREYDDDDNFIPDPRKRRAVGLPCDGKTIYNDNGDDTSDDDGIFCAPEPAEQCNANTEPKQHDSCSDGPVNVSKPPVFDITPCKPQDDGPEPVPLAAVDPAGHVLVLTPRQPHDVQITGETSLNEQTTSNAQDVNTMHNACNLRCFNKCCQSGFKFASSSSQVETHRPRRMMKHNSYFRDFEVNICSRRSYVSREQLLVYQRLIVYAEDVHYARDHVINYKNVFVTYEELGLSLRREAKNPVHSHVINALCAKLFKDNHPSKSKKHYFFSPVSDYLMGHDGNKLYLQNNCLKCFSAANGIHKFTSSDYLIFPVYHDNHWFVFIVAVRDRYFVFLDSFFEEDSPYHQFVRSKIIRNFILAWDNFVGDDWNFEEFTIHYAPVPKQSMEFFAKHDDGIFVMKYLELWDAYINMMVQFAPNHISDIRVQYVHDLVFSRHNLLDGAKALLKNHNVMGEARDRVGFRPARLFNN
ncbi:hypothetical protein U9M48_029299 [Paspalum notatum var. saurae]|uniref:Ubiquitin-like protease family profile domain-containing protein n=1 Tax=Paspalum notatum var. saurae TaxID=547442 RepID=A0AAQ3TYC4_PASNO